MNQEKKEELKEFFLAAVDCDGYQEWLEHIFQWHTIQENNAGKKYLYNPILKQTLEELLEKRETITLEELNEYIGKYWINPTKKNNLVLLLTVYQDLFGGDPEYKRDLVNSVEKYIKINKKHYQWVRGKIPYSEIEEEMKDDK